MDYEQKQIVLRPLNLYALSSIFLIKLYPSSAISHGSEYSRQTLIAFAKSGSAREKDSIVYHPSYFASFKALNTSSHRTKPLPGVPLSFSLICTCAKCGLIRVIGPVILFSSIFA